MFVHDHEAEQRSFICNRCPNRIGNNCDICGCNISLKTMFADEYCPDKPARW